MRIKLAVIILLSVLDLVFTIHVYSLGILHEMNPLAQYIIDNTFSPIICLSLFKSLTVYICCWLLWEYQSKRIAHWAALLCILLLTATMALWFLNL